MTDLVLYDQMRSALAKCVEIDEVAGIKNKAEQLEAYARIRDDMPAQRNWAEFRLRACMRIGEISRDLEKAEKIGGPGKFKVPNDGKFKSEVLADAGISTSTANRYEGLVGGKEKQVETTAIAAAESYFAEQRQAEQLVSMRGLKAAVDQALSKTFGEAVPKQPRPKYEPDLLVHFLYSANWAIEKRNFDPSKLAAEVMEDFAQDELDACRFFIPLIKEFIEQLTKRFSHVK